MSQKTYAKDTPAGLNGKAVKEDNIITYSIKYTLVDLFKENKIIIEDDIIIEVEDVLHNGLTIRGMDIICLALCCLQFDSFFPPRGSPLFNPFSSCL